MVWASQRRMWLALLGVTGCQPRPGARCAACLTWLQTSSPCQMTLRPTQCSGSPSLMRWVDVWCTWFGPLLNEHVVKFMSSVATSMKLLNLVRDNVAHPEVQPDACGSGYCASTVFVGSSRCENTVLGLSTRRLSPRTHHCQASTPVSAHHLSAC